jgi:vitamin B12 transporter
MAIRRSFSTPNVRFQAAPLALALALLLFAAAGFAGAQEADYALDDVSITATKIPEPTIAVPASVSVITSEEIAARGAKTVADAIKTATGVVVSDDGPVGAQKTVSIRGSTSNQVLVLVDGVRVNSALSGSVDLAQIPAESIDRIEVMRGGGSALYGADAVGGVINIITKKKAEPLVVSIENGSFIPTKRVEGFGANQVEKSAGAESLVDSQKLSFSASPKIGDLLVRASGGVDRAANNYTFLDGNYQVRGRQNADYLGLDGSVGATLPLGTGETLALDTTGTIRTLGVPGTMSSPTLDARERDEKASGSLKYSSERFLSDAFTLQAGARAGYTGIDYRDGTTGADDANHKLYSAGLDVEQRAYLSDPVSLLYGLSTAWDRASSSDLGSPTRGAFGAFIEPTLSAESLTFRPAIRYDYYSDFSPGGIGASLGVSWRLSETETVKANLSRSFRVPTFEDLYWPASNGVEGNPDLKPETGYGLDLGLEKDNGDLSWSTFAYVRYSKDVILWQEGSDGVWRPSNYGAALYPGIEEELKMKFENDYWAKLNYDFLYSYLLDEGYTVADDKRLPMTPVHTLNATLGFSRGGLSWSATGKFRSLRYLKTANQGYLPSDFTLDAVVKRKLSERWSVYFAVDNLFGEQYQMVSGYPMPGTKFRTGLEARF